MKYKHVHIKVYLPINSLKFTFSITFQHNLCNLAIYLCVYNSTRPIKSPSDLVKIMNIGNDLYGHLSHSAQHGYLLLTEVPDTLCLGVTI